MEKKLLVMMLRSRTTPELVKTYLKCIMRAEGTRANARVEENHFGIKASVSPYSVLFPRWRKEM